MKAVGINPDNWEDLTAGRSKWRRTLQIHMKSRPQKSEHTGKSDPVLQDSTPNTTAIFLTAIVTPAQGSFATDENMREAIILWSLDRRRSRILMFIVVHFIFFLSCQYLFLWAGAVCAVGKISAFQPQGPQFDPRLCQDLN